MFYPATVNTIYTKALYSVLKAQLFITVYRVYHRTSCQLKKVIEHAMLDHISQVSSKENGKKVETVR